MVNRSMSLYEAGAVALTEEELKKAIECEKNQIDVIKCSFNAPGNEGKADMIITDVIQRKKRIEALERVLRGETDLKQATKVLIRHISIEQDKVENDAYNLEKNKSLGRMSKYLEMLEKVIDKL